MIENEPTYTLVLTKHEAALLAAFSWLGLATYNQDIDSAANMIGPLVNILNHPDGIRAMAELGLKMNALSNWDEQNVRRN